jgi:hypothetical protein
MQPSSGAAAHNVISTDPVGFDDVAPDASAMIESMRAYGYTLSTAVADLVDNSIAAGCTTVWLQFEWAGADSWVTITDDGHGMTESELRDAMRLGSRNPLQERSPSDLGRFGLGLKTASLSQCRRLTVASRRAPGAEWVRRWDLDHLAREEIRGWQLLRSPAPASGARATIRSELTHGTLVLWELLDRVVSADTSPDDERLHRHFLEMIEKVEAHLAMVFHRYLSREGSRRLRLYVNGHSVMAWDPFLESHEATDKTPQEPIRIPGHDQPIMLRGFVLPHKDRLGDEAHAKASGPAGWNAQQGFYLYRNERLIVAGSWLGLGGARPWTKEEHYKLARIRLDIPNSMDHLWHLDVKKSSAHPPPRLRDQLTGLAQGVRQNARAVFAHRGRHRDRAERREYERPWRVVRNAGIVGYRIDRNHPVVAALLSGVSKERASELEAALRIIEETVPVEQIWLDVAEQPDAPARPFHGTTSLQVRSLIGIAYDAIRRNRGASHAGAIEILLGCEEFASPECRAVIATLTEERIG